MSNRLDRTEFKHKKNSKALQMNSKNDIIIWYSYRTNKYASENHKISNFGESSSLFVST
jgi:hypothetical protein